MTPLCWKFIATINSYSKQNTSAKTVRIRGVAELIVGSISSTARTKTFWMQLMKAFVAEMYYNQLLIDSATYLLTITSPTLKSIAMSLYNISIRVAKVCGCAASLDVTWNCC